MLENLAFFLKGTLLTIEDVGVRISLHLDDNLTNINFRDFRLFSIYAVTRRSRPRL